MSTTVGEGAFLSSCYILLVPVAGLIFLKKKPAWTAWLGAAIAVVGVYFISMEPGQGDIHVTPGNLWMLLAACGFTWQILEVDEYSKGTDLMWLASIQFGVVALLSFAGMLLFERCSWEDLLLARGSILYAALVSGAFCYTSQVIAQKHVEPTLASLIMGAESVFATLSGVIFLQENIGIRKYIGCALVLAAIVAAQMKVSGKERA
ncbi:MAG: DMT family transporter [Lachnospiraceae bacterium]|nr:DMT family transporter [Lachnospiraceae bacterium]